MTVVLRKNFYTIYTFLVQRLECYFCRYPFYQITSFRKKGQFSDSRIRRYGGIISFICYSLYDTYLLRIKRTDSIVPKRRIWYRHGYGNLPDSAPYLYKCDRQQCRLVPDIFLARQCCPFYQAFQQTWYCAPTLVQSAKSTNPTIPIIQHFFIFFPSYILATNSRKRMVMTAAA